MGTCTHSSSTLPREAQTHRRRKNQDLFVLLFSSGCEGNKQAKHHCCISALVYCVYLAILLWVNLTGAKKPEY